jgi:hypothetical protein
MYRGLTAGSIRTIRWRTWLLASLGAGALIVPAVTAGVASAETTWLCRPGISADPCESSEEATVELGNGSTSIEHAQPASNPPIDCFYVYPTVSSQLTVNANLEIGAEEKQVAIDQASRFSQQCKVYAPIYPQITVHALKEGGVSEGASETAYLGVLVAFEEYLNRYSEGRGFVLIGHSQGALMLKQLIEERIDPNPALRSRLVSAMLLGGNVLVPKGETVGGDFKNIPACESAGQTHCVLAYSSFLNEPPGDADFGRVSSPLLGVATSEQIANDEVLCVNPALAVQGAGWGPLQRYESTTPIPGFGVAPSAPTPWVSMPGQYTGQCDRANGASWLQLNYVGPNGDPREQVAEVLGPEWGTHLNDVNIALGNLVDMAGLQSATYQAEPPPAETPVPPETVVPPETPRPPESPATSPAPAEVPLLQAFIPPAITHTPAAPKKSCKPVVVRHHVTHKPPPACAKPKSPAPKHKSPAPKHKSPAPKQKRPAHKHKKPTT